MSLQRITGRIAPLPVERPFPEVVLSHLTNCEVTALEVETNGQELSSTIPHAGDLYVLVEYQTGLWKGNRSIVIVTYQVLTMGGGRRELRYSACPEHLATTQAIHSCPLTLLQQVSPTQSPNARAWRMRCWRSLQAQAAARNSPHPSWDLSLPLALVSSVQAQILKIHTDYVYLLAWQGPMPNYGDAMHGILHIQQIVHMQGIGAPEVVVPIATLDAAVDVLLERRVPLSSGWILL